MSFSAIWPSSPPFAFEAAVEYCRARAWKSSPPFARAMISFARASPPWSSLTTISWSVTVAGFVNSVPFSFSYSALSSDSDSSTRGRMSRSMIMRRTIERSTFCRSSETVRPSRARAS